ncbi:Ribosome recycling factor [Fragilaria crotonensis]|nr:Ribosome recycling factor [Fragilaria crotonensis]
MMSVSSVGRRLPLLLRRQVPAVVAVSSLNISNEWHCHGQSVTMLLHQQQHTNQLNQTRRWFSRKGAKMGQHLDSLREQAHRVSHEEAKEKRNKKKGKKEGGSASTIEDSDDDAFSSEPELHDHHDVDDDHNDGTDSDDAPALPEPRVLKASMIKVVDRLKESFKSIRGAEPTPELFDSIMVDAYGDTAPLSTVAQVVIVSPTLANVTCFDPAVAKDVSNAIRDSLELNPQLEEDGVVKVPLPRVSMETRQKIVKQLNKQAEASRTRIRNIRRKAMDKIKLGKEGKLEGISKDDAFRVAKELDAVVEDVIKLVNDAVHQKEASIMAV